MFINNTEVHSDCDIASALRNSLQLRLPAQEQKETFHSLAQGVFLTLLSMSSQPEKTKDELKVTIISESHNSCFPQRNPPLVSSVHYKSLFSTWHQSVPTGFPLPGIQTDWRFRAMAYNYVFNLEREWGKLDRQTVLKDFHVPAEDMKFRDPEYWGQTQNNGSCCHTGTY